MLHLADQQVKSPVDVSGAALTVADADANVDGTACQAHLVPLRVHTLTDGAASTRGTLSTPASTGSGVRALQTDYKRRGRLTPERRGCHLTPITMNM
jgi:hypothetical protein